MNQKIAVVTGGGQGLGRETARAFARAGHAVAVLGRTAAKLEETCALIGAQVTAIPVDLTDPDQVREAFRTVDRRLGGVDVLINNAATYVPFMIGEASDEQLRVTVDGTLMSTLFCLREAIPRMQARGGGDLITVTSESVHMPAPFLTLYAALKAALETVHAGLRKELGGSNIRPMIFQTGRITESSAGEHWDQATLARFEKIYVEQGYAAMIAQNAVTPQTLAATMVHMAMTPREAVIEAVHMRAGQ